MEIWTSFIVKSQKIFLCIIFFSVMVVFNACSFAGDKESDALESKLTIGQQNINKESIPGEVEATPLESNAAKSDLENDLDKLARRKVFLYGQPQLAVSKESLELHEEKQKSSLDDFHKAGQGMGNNRIRQIGRSIVLIVIIAGIMVLTIYARKIKNQRRILIQRQSPKKAEGS